VGGLSTEAYVAFNNCMHMNTCLQSMYAKLSGIAKGMGKLNRDPMSLVYTSTSELSLSFSRGGEPGVLTNWLAARGRPVRTAHDPRSSPSAPQLREIRPRGPSVEFRWKKRTNQLTIQILSALQSGTGRPRQTPRSTAPGEQRQEQEERDARNAAGIGRGTDLLIS